MRQVLRTVAMLLLGLARPATAKSSGGAPEPMSAINGEVFLGLQLVASPRSGFGVRAELSGALAPLPLRVRPIFGPFLQGELTTGGGPRLAAGAKAGVVQAAGTDCGGFYSLPSVQALIGGRWDRRVGHTLVFGGAVDVVAGHLELDLAKTRRRNEEVAVLDPEVALGLLAPLVAACLGG